MLTARHVMTTELIQLDRSTPVTEAAKQMVSHRVGSVIVTAAGYPVGIVTETDITHHVALGTDFAAKRLEDIMSSPLFSTSPDTDITEVANTMTTNRIKKMPIVEHQQVIGVVTQTDIIRNVLRVQAQNKHETNKPLKQAIPSVPHSVTTDDVKYWYMRCLSCGYSFLNQEYNSKLLMVYCPRCSGKIEYDPNPPI
jgi:CBS domain-containing protein/DNA-directed RNA polymerase subunit RPC12/RpoP